MTLAIVTSLFPASVVKMHKDLALKHVCNTIGGLIASLLLYAASSHRALLVKQAVSTCERFRHRMHWNLCSIFLSPGEILHATQSEASMSVLRPRKDEPLNCDDTTPLQPAMRVEEHRDGEYPHP